jgi:hypothetical protein
MSTTKEKKTMAIGQYLLAKDGKTKYIKFSTHDGAPPEVKKKVKAIIEALGTDVVYVNLFDAEFREKYDIPDFAKGRIVVKKDGEAGAPKGKKGSAEDDSEVDF